MGYWRIVSIFFISCLAIGCATMPSLRMPRPSSWICYYGKIPKGSSLKSIDLAILDPDNVPNVLKYTKNGTVCVGYVSVGEAEDYRFYWENIKDAPFIIEENEDWEGNYYIDPRSEQWKSLLINEVIPKVLNRGYKGIFLDTLDTAEYLEWKYPDEYEGAVDGMVDLVRAIRQRYPSIVMVSNNGYPLLYRIAPYIDAVLVEDLYTTYDFETGTYGIQDPHVTEEHRAMLTDISTRYHVPILTLDYIDPNDTTGKRSIESSSVLDGFYPHVGDINLELLPAQIQKEGAR